MNSTWNYIFFGVYPYLAGTVFLVGSLLRYEFDQAGWSTYSTLHAVGQ